MPLYFKYFANAILLLGSVAAHSLPNGQNLGPAKITIDSALQNFMGSVLIVKDGHVVADRSFGSANVEWNIPNSSSTKFRIGSLTKQFTAASILLLAERRRLRLDDPVSKYVDNTPQAWRDITLFELLTHTSGIVSLTDLPDDEATVIHGGTPAEIVSRFRDKPLQFAPGSKARYSNSGYILLGMVVEKASGISYGGFLHSNIFGPLGMYNTGIESKNVVVPRLASGYRIEDGKPEPAGFIDMTVPFAAGDLYSTTHDLELWEEGLFGGKILGPESLKTMFTKNQGNYGLGVMVTEEAGYRLISHTGGIQGFRGDVRYYPDEHLSVIVLSNTESNNTFDLSRLLSEQTLAQMDTKALSMAVPQILATTHVASVSFANIVKGKVTVVQAYGEQSAGVPATPSTLYNIASMTKPISAEVILRLASQGKLSLDEPMYIYWTDPDIANDERRKLLTPRLALSHQTGFPNWRSETGGKLTFKRTPGTAYGYSGEGLEYVARFAEKKIGQPFEVLAQRTVFGPSHMTSSAYTTRKWFKGRIAVPSDGKEKWLAPVMVDKFSAANMVYSTPSDYSRFLIEVMDGAGLTSAIHAERSGMQVDQDFKPCTAAWSVGCPDKVGFGLGWEIVKIKGKTFWMHTGRDPGVFTVSFFDPIARTGTIIFTNSENGAEVVVPLLHLLRADPVFIAYLEGQR
jgi:CubicO group peptidase (beta-lactamase class C family)